jgi:hypothetical protein
MAQSDKRTCEITISATQNGGFATTYHHCHLQILLLLFLPQQRSQRPDVTKFWFFIPPIIEKRETDQRSRAKRERRLVADAALRYGLFEDPEML